MQGPRPKQVLDAPVVVVPSSCLAVLPLLLAAVAVAGGVQVLRMAFRVRPVPGSGQGQVGFLSTSGPSWDLPFCTDLATCSTTSLPWLLGVEEAYMLRGGAHTVGCLSLQ